MRKRTYIMTVVALMGMLLNGCVKEEKADKGSGETDSLGSTEYMKTEEAAEAGEAEEVQGVVMDSASETITTESEALEVPEILNFVDVFGQQYQVEIDPNVKKHDYCVDAFLHNGNSLSYIGDERYAYRLGVDVSHHQGVIDWESVKAAGYDFAFLRIGYRGYGEAGNICLDNRFYANIKDAQAVGIDVGVYFFSQAINEAEAREEAEFVLETLGELELQLPVVYDPESILDADARTDNVTGEQFTKNTIEFCNLIKAAGYEPMIYSNMLWEAYEFDLEQLSEYPIWYADYEALPQTPYYFSFWQYTNTAKVDGIDGVVDLNIQLIPVEE